MCDVKKYEKLYQEIEKLQPEDTLQLVLVCCIVDI